MNIPRKFREELNKLSLEVHSVSSFWSTALNKGIQQLVSETRAHSKARPIRVSEVKYYTLEEIYKRLLDEKAVKDAKTKLEAK